MTNLISKIATLALSLGIASSALAGYDYSNKPAGTFRRAAMAARAKIAGAERAVTGGSTPSGKSYVVGVALNNGNVNRVLVNKKTGAVTDQGNILPEAKRLIEKRVRQVEGKKGFTVVRELAKDTNTVNRNQQLSTRGGIVRFGIRIGGKVVSNRQMRLRDKVVSGDATDRDYTSF